MIADYPHTILMTGATGFLGHYALRELLQEGMRVAVLLREPLAENVSRLTGMLERIGFDVEPYLAGGQLLWVEGMLPDRLPEADWGRTDAVLNCAASLKLFTNGDGDPQKTNVEGTRALLDWMRHYHIERFHAVSTAYTCGWNEGMIREEFHRREPEFQTDYEKSKWIAETILEQWSKGAGHILTVFRPSLIVGDSTTGYTTQFGGMYQLARLLSVLKEQYVRTDNGSQTYIPLRIPGRPENPHNIVPVDFVARVLAKVVSSPEFHGRIYHLTNPQPPTNDTIKRFCEEYFGLCGGHFTDVQEVVGQCSPAESLLWDQYHLLTQRMTNNPIFDMTHTQEVLQKKGLTFPVLDRQRMTRLFDYAAACGWRSRPNGHNNGQEK